MLVTRYIVEESSLSLTADGYEAVEVYHVSGIEADPRLVQYTALNAPDIPAYGDFLPGVPGVRVLDKSARAIDTRQARIAVTYRVPQGGQEDPPSEIAQAQVELGSAVVETVTQRDSDGNQIRVPITITETDADGNTVTTTDTQTGEVSIQVPQAVLRFTRREPYSPWQKSLVYTGRVNRNAIWGGDERTWLCRGINGTSNDGGQTYEVTYEFQFAPEKWDATVVFTDAETGKPHEDVNLQTKNGVETVRVYPEEDFSRLNLAL